MKRGTSGINLLLAVNKPEGMTSHDVVNHVRRAVGERRVGHAGTLDPAATGVLVIGVGQATRLMGLLTTDRKSYLATVCFGAQTNTDDAEGQIIREVVPDERLADEAYARDVLASMVGPQLQTPPAFSAISVNGKRAYELARSGKDVQLEPRAIQIYTADLISVERTDDRILWNCAFCVSKGTYVRVIARDLGTKVGGAAYLSRLCRTVSGSVTIGDCVTLDALREAGAAGVANLALDPAHALGLPMRLLSAAELSLVQHGNPIPVGSAPAQANDLVSLVRDDRLWGVWRCEKGLLKSQVNIPQGVAGVRS